MSSCQLRNNIKRFVFEKEVSRIGKEWWYVTTLIRESKDLPVFEVDIASIDLGVMPWELTSVLHFVEHVLDLWDCNTEYPIIMSPSGWIINGWHRVVKAIIEDRKTIPAVRFFELPEPDGTDDAKED